MRQSRSSYNELWYKNCEKAFENTPLISLIIESQTPIEHFNSFIKETLEQVTIPSSIVSIGDKAFDSCSALKRIDLPSSVRTIDAFNGCSSLVEIPFELVTDIGQYAFYNCETLESVKLSSARSIKYYIVNIFGGHKRESFHWL